MKKICTFSASNSADSINRTLLHLAADKITGHKINVIDIRDFSMPMYSLDKEKQDGFPATATQLRALFAEQDAFIIAIPEHNGSMPAVFKNVIDWLSRLVDQQQPIFASKPVFLLSTSPGANGGSTNLQSLTQLMPWWGADVRGTYSLGSFYDNFFEGQLNLEHDRRLCDGIAEFVLYLQDGTTAA